MQTLLHHTQGSAAIQRFALNAQHAQQHLQQRVQAQLSPEELLRIDDLALPTLSLSELTDAMEAEAREAVPSAFIAGFATACTVLHAQLSAVDRVGRGLA